MREVTGSHTDDGRAVSSATALVVASRLTDVSKRAAALQMIAGDWNVLLLEMAVDIGKAKSSKVRRSRVQILRIRDNGTMTID